MTDSTKSLLGKLKDLKDLKDSKKALQDMEKDIEEHVETIRKALHDRTVANDLFSKRLHDRQELLDKLRNLQDDYGKARNMRDGLAKLSKMEDDYDRDQAIERAKRILIGEQMEVLREKQQDYLSALR
jgi:DNA repair exonuclease SbcCD ATPase subunit